MLISLNNINLNGRNVINIFEKTIKAIINIDYFITILLKCLVNHIMHNPYLKPIKLVKLLLFTIFLTIKLTLNVNLPLNIMNETH